MFTIPIVFDMIVHVKGECNVKILKITVSGFKLLENDFTINFLNRSKVTDKDKQGEIIEYYDNLFLPTVTVLAGKNSSGKSTVISLLDFVQELLFYGRIKYDKLYFREDHIRLEVFFTLGDKTLYRYVGEIHQPETGAYKKEQEYCIMKNESLYSRDYAKSYGKRNLDKPFEKNEQFKSNVHDTSLLHNLKENPIFLLNVTNVLRFWQPEKIFEYIKDFNISSELKYNILSLFDENIEKLEYDEKDEKFHFSMKGWHKKRVLTGKELGRILSEGTKKGLSLLVMVIFMLRVGGTLVIDEIENSFHKNLVENIIMILQDHRINKNKASLLFTTHYAEILDILNRRDSIFILEKDEYIACHNLSSKYPDRGELSKSNQFNNNTFKTLLNYDQIMALKKELRHEVSRIA